MTLLDTLTARRVELDAQHQRDTEENKREAAARQEQIDLVYRSRLGEIDIMLKAVGAQSDDVSVPPAGASGDTASGPVQRATAKSASPNLPAGAGRKPGGASKPPAPPTDAPGAGAKRAGTKAVSGSGQRRSRVASSLGDLVPRQVFEIMRKDGYIGASELQQMYGVKRLGPVLSAWKRTARTLGADLGDLIIRARLDGTDTRIYRITAAGIEVLAPGSEALTNRR
ncbi:MAG: hypothetical protein OXG35_14430 [Acidobacteria bacterium]|nr:hypothetical protein [Acidobacteriota bacterium]